MSETEYEYKWLKPFKKLADCLTSQYHGDITITIKWKPMPWYDTTEYTLRVDPYDGSDSFMFSFDASDIKEELEKS